VSSDWWSLGILRGGKFVEERELSSSLVVLHHRLLPRGRREFLVCNAGGIDLMARFVGVGVDHLACAVMEVGGMPRRLMGRGPRGWGVESSCSDQPCFVFLLCARRYARDEEEVLRGRVGDGMNRGKDIWYEEQVEHSREQEVTQRSTKMSALLSVVLNGSSVLVRPDASRVILHSMISSR
jgi:hypothetical protein